MSRRYAKAAADIAAEFPDVMHLGRVDCVKEPELYDRFQIEGFPTIKLFHFGVFANGYQQKNLGYEAILEYARGWAEQPDVKTGWLFAETIDDVYRLIDYDKEQNAYTSAVPTLLTLFDPARVYSDDSRQVLESLANASFRADTKHTRFIVTTDRRVLDVFMQITEDCGLTEVNRGKSGKAGAFAFVCYCELQTRVHFV